METRSKSAPSAEALDIISRFCEGHPVTRVEPTECELAALCHRCSALDQSDVAAAIYEQLAGAINSHVWQPRLRALAVIEHLYRAESSRSTAKRAVRGAGKLLRHLATEVPECQEAAAQVLLLRQLAQVLPSGEEVRVAKEGGLLHFLADGTPEKRLVEEDLISLPEPPCADLIELTDETGSAILPAAPGRPNDTGSCTMNASPVADPPSLVVEAPSTTPDSYVLPADLVFSTEPVPVGHPSVTEFFNIADDDTERSNPELMPWSRLSRVLDFTPQQVAAMPFLGTGRDCIPLTLGKDAFASVVADTYVKCLKA